MTGFYHLDNGSTWSIIDQDLDFKNFQLLKSLIGHDIFFANIGWHQLDLRLPGGHKAYLVMTEGPDYSWIIKQTDFIDAPIFVLGMVNDYDFQHGNILYLPWIEWHYQCRQMVDAFDWSGKSTSKHVLSSMSARVTQSKIWASMAVINAIDKKDRLLSLNNNVESKNVHHWSSTGIQRLDDLTQQYRDNYMSEPIALDYFFSGPQTSKSNHDYRLPAYQDCVFNINNESWHYSFHQEQDRSFCWPGPFLTEKTMKVLCSETALLANGQFDTYRTLESLGFKFDYGLDLSYDAMVGNFDRALGLIDVIEKLANHTADWWFERTLESRRHNRQHIVNGDFYDICEEKNKNTLDRILERVE